MNETIFWQIIEAAWMASPELNAARKLALRTNDESLLESLSYELSDVIGENIRLQLNELDRKALTAFNHIIEEKLFHIDRQDVHQYTGGSADSFLHCRSFIVGMGEAYYNGIDNNPAMAAMDVEAGNIGFIGYEVYEENFTSPFVRNSVHGIGTRSNIKGW